MPDNRILFGSGCNPRVRIQISLYRGSRQKDLWTVTDRFKFAAQNQRKDKSRIAAKQTGGLGDRNYIRSGVHSFT
jgi:hypothetical protein